MITIPTHVNIKPISGKLNHRRKIPAITMTNPIITNHFRVGCVAMSPRTSDSSAKIISPYGDFAYFNKFINTSLNQLLKFIYSIFYLKVIL